MDRKILLLVLIGLLFALASARPAYQYGDFQTFFAIRSIRDIAKSQNYIYFLADNGIIRYDWIYDEWKLPYTYFDILVENPPIALAIDTTWDDLLIRTEFGAYKVSESSLGEMSPISFIPDEVQWSFGCQYDFEEIIPPIGMFYDKQRDAFIGRNFERYPISCCIRDGQNIWIGTIGGGIFNMDEFSQRAERVNVGLGSDRAQQIYISDDNIFLGGTSIGYNQECAITKWDFDQKWEWAMADTTSLLRNSEISAFAMSNGMLFAGTPEGIAVIDPDYMQTERFLSNTNNLLGDSVSALIEFEERIYAGTKSGLSKIDPISLRIQRLTKPTFGQITCFAKNKDTLWIGTENEIYFYTLDDGVKYYPTDDYVTEGYIDAIAYDKYDSTLWIASDYGILRQSPLRIFDRLDYGKYLRFFDIAPTERYVWFGTNKGVLRFRKEDQSWMWYEASDGIASNIVHSVVPDGDFIWFGTPYGATRFLWNVKQRIDY
ncbi:MAG: hypothetical protein ACLFSQ_00815 [Candidatus Zixiibacteriota bacterium]